MKQILTLLTALLVASAPLAAEPLLAKCEVFPPKLNGIARYRIPGIVVTTKGTVLAYCEARKNNSSDWGEIEVHLRRSTDGGKTWPINKTIQSGKSAYSDLAVLPDGTVLCFFERADSIDCARFNLEWLQQP